MRACPSCGHNNADGVDFCSECGEYLRWDPTRLTPAVPTQEGDTGSEDSSGDSAAASATEEAAPPPAPPADSGQTKSDTAVSEDAQGVVTPVAPPPPVDPDSVNITLRRPEDVGGTGEVATSVEPGGQVFILATIRNQSGVVDNYDLKLKGLPEEWYTITPATLYLVPFGSPSGQSEQEVEVRFHPPRSSEAEAREWPVKLVAVSRAHDVEVGAARAKVTIAPFEQLESEMRPERASGRCKRGYAVAVKNRGNAPADVRLEGSDPDEEMKFEFEQQQFQVEPGRIAGSKFKVRPPKQIYIGRIQERQFEISAQAIGGGAVTPPIPGLFRQKPWLPKWVLVLLPILLAILVAVAVALWLLLGGKTTVPDLRDVESQFDAEILLSEADLELGGWEEVVDESQEPGTVLEQTPLPGEEVDKGTEVFVTVAIGTAQVEVPDLTGLNIPDAADALQSRGLVLGAVQPAPDDPVNAQIIRQTPAAGESVEEGKAVDVFLPGAEEEAAEEPAEEPEEVVVPPEEEEGGGEEAAAGAVPDVRGLEFAAAVSALEAEGLTADGQRQFSALVTPDFVIDQLPPPNDPAPPDRIVMLFVSVGEPDILIDKDGDLLLMDGFSGEIKERVADTEEVEEEANWHPNGEIIAYRRGAEEGLTPGQIWIQRVGDPDSARPLTAEGFDDGRPAFSPTGRAVAFRRIAEGDSDLCLAPAEDPAPGSERCIDEELDSIIVGRPAWAPDGRAILVTANDEDNQLEFLLYTTDNPESTNPGDWDSQGFVTEEFHGEGDQDRVSFAAFSPSIENQVVAFTANWRGGTHLLYLSPFEGNRLGEPTMLDVRGCEVDWRSDGGEIVVIRADVECLGESGEVVLVDPNNLDDPELKSHSEVGANNPAWRPQSLE